MTEFKPGDKVLVKKNMLHGKHHPENPTQIKGATYEGRVAVVKTLGISHERLPYATVNFLPDNPELATDDNEWLWSSVNIDLEGLEPDLIPVTDEEIRQVFKLKETP